MQRVIVVACQLAAIRIENPHGQIGGVWLNTVAVRHVADSNRIHLDREPPTGGHRHPIDVHIILRLLADRPADRDIRRRGHRRRQRVVIGGLSFLVFLHLVNDGKGADVESRCVRELSSRSDPEGVLAQRTVRRDLKLAFQRAVIGLAVVGDFDGADTRTVEDELLRIDEPTPGDCDLDSRACLAAPRPHGIEVVPVRGGRLGDDRRPTDCPADCPTDRFADNHSGPRHPRRPPAAETATHVDAKTHDHCRSPDSSDAPAPPSQRISQPPSQRISSGWP